MAAIPMSRIEAVVFDLFGTLVYEFPRADWEGWLETSAAILEADVDAFIAAWQATGIERQAGRPGALRGDPRPVPARPPPAREAWGPRRPPSSPSAPRARGGNQVRQEGVACVWGPGSEVGDGL